MGKPEDGRTASFNWRKARRTGAVFGIGGGVSVTLAKVAGAMILIEPVTATAVLLTAGITAVCTGSTAVAAEYVNHKLDDPVFDARTTILFDLVGLAFGFLLFVIPAMQLEVALRPGSPTPGPFAVLALCFTTFGVVVLRGLLMNLGIVRDGERLERDFLP